MATFTSYNLEASHILHATGKDSSGNDTTSSLDLNTFIGNVNGAFSWGGTNFSPGAQNVTLSSDGGTLDADLPDINGQMAHSTINLSHHLPDTNDPTFGVYFDVPHSTAHAVANTNQAADQAVQSQIGITGAQLANVQTIQGDAANYNPGDVGNPPAPGSAVGKQAAQGGAQAFAAVFFRILLSILQAL